MKFPIKGFFSKCDQIRGPNHQTRHYSQCSLCLNYCWAFFDPMISGMGSCQNNKINKTEFKNITLSLNPLKVVGPNSILTKILK